MTSIPLTITHPAHDALLTGSAANLTLQGSVDHANSAALFYKWYSSLNNPAGIVGPEDAPKAALNWPNHGPAALSFATSLAVGSHTLTLAAKDVEGETQAELKTVLLAGIAGGPAAEGVTNPCVVHVFIAEMLLPDPGGPVPDLSRAESLLEAVAPFKWDAAEYQAVNRIRFRWRFEPVGGGTPVAGLPALDADEAAIAQFQQQLHFGLPDDDHAVPFVRYQGALPVALALNQTYRLVLRVEDTNPPHPGHEVFRNVRIIA